jgi:hypothetical protein
MLRLLIAQFAGNLAGLLFSTEGKSSMVRYYPYSGGKKQTAYFVGREAEVGLTEILVPFDK